MKLITLNLWGGIVFDPLMRFIERSSKDTDIFCFQEVLFGTDPGFTKEHKARVNIFEEIESRLPDFTAYTYFAPEEARHFQKELLPDELQAGQAIFVRKTSSVSETGGFRGYKGGIPEKSNLGGKITGSCQWITLALPHGSTTILNVHGLWQENTWKEDTEERLLQSSIINDFFKARTGKRIVCGDLNLKNDGESIKNLEKHMENLVKKFKITSTRSSLYPGKEKFADYVLVSPEVKVEHFDALPDEVSDHLALLLEFK